MHPSMERMASGARPCTFALTSLDAQTCGWGDFVAPARAVREQPALSDGVKLRREHEDGEAFGQFDHGTELDPAGL